MKPTYHNIPHSPQTVQTHSLRTLSHMHKSSLYSYSSSVDQRVASPPWLRLLQKNTTLSTSVSKVLSIRCLRGSNSFSKIPQKQMRTEISLVGWQLFRSASLKISTWENQWKKRTFSTWSMQSCKRTWHKVVGLSLTCRFSTKSTGLMRWSVTKLSCPRSTADSSHILYKFNNQTSNGNTSQRDWCKSQRTWL